MFQFLIDIQSDRSELKSYLNSPTPDKLANFLKDGDIISDNLVNLKIS